MFIFNRCDINTENIKSLWNILIDPLPLLKWKNINIRKLQNTMVVCQRCLVEIKYYERINLHDALGSCIRFTEIDDGFIRSCTYLPACLEFQQIPLGKW